MQNIISKLDEFIMKLPYSIFGNKEYDKEIFHYTSAIGLESILFNSSNNTIIWASRFDCLNDISEGQIFLSIYREVCEKLYSDGKVSKSFFDLINDLKPANGHLFILNKNDKIKVSSINAKLKLSHSPLKR